jgi:leucyl-tRNA synthetase
LIGGLDTVDWPESTKLAQKNWIARSEGARVFFSLRAGGEELADKMEVFTTRPDTLFGCTYAVFAPEHELVQKYRDKIGNYAAVQEYLELTRKKTDLERTDLNKDKSGVRLEGLVAVNPVNGEEVPLFVADYVLSGYGTGAVMAVPAHDERDFEFANKYSLPIKQVVRADNSSENLCFCGEGTSINSDFLDGLPTAEAKTAIISWLAEHSHGAKTVTYRLRDWLVSRQRYWGAPIPMIYCDHCGMVPVPESDLPVLLPTDVDFKPTGESPLVDSVSFHNVQCPTCGAKARRESDTMDTFVCSSWYYLRYADPHNAETFASREALDKYLPVDLYVGGAEHTVLHLLYARFFTKVLKKYGLTSFDEPFAKLRHQGIILAEDGQKMSKSKGNVVNPDDVVQSSGADALRMYEMFMGPFNEMKPWNTKGIVGVTRFLDRVWDYFAAYDESRPTTDKAIISLYHKTLKQVSLDIENFRFNTAISRLMELLNALKSSQTHFLPRAETEGVLILLAPLAPHLAEELWERLGHSTSIFLESWPTYDEKLLVDDEFELVFQVDGKLRGKAMVAADISEENAIKTALECDSLEKWLAGREIVKKVYVKGKLVSIVTKEVSS